MEPPCLRGRTCQKAHGWWIPAGSVIVLRVLGGLFFPRNSGNCYDTSDDWTSKTKKRKNCTNDKERERGSSGLICVGDGLAC